MSFQTLERHVLNQTRIAVKNPKLKLSDLLEWTTSEEVARKNLTESETLIHLPDPGVWVALSKSNDKREVK